MQMNLEPFQIRSEDFEPAYMKLFYSEELYRRSRQALRFLANYRLCSRDCELNRLNMDQYFPSGKVSEKKYQEINLCPHSNELGTVEKIARQKGLQRFDQRAV
jgi:uncharacterized Fe-S radical SAM superfamily protein PflX